MIAYWAVVSARFRMLLQYRAAAFAGFATQLFWGFIRVMIFDAFYRSTTAPQPMTFSQVVSYIWLSQAMMRILPWVPDSDIVKMVRNGNVAYELLRPVDIYGLWYSRAIANLTSPTLLRSVPMFIVAALFLGLQTPPSLGSAAAWLIATAGAVILACTISILLTISLFWTISGEGISHLVMVSVWLFSGMIVPLPLFPDWAQTILRVLPFRGLMDTPFRLYMGHIPPTEVFGVITHQLIWATVLFLFGRWLLRRGLGRVVIQGG